ncbi:hypothetical protein HPP92_006864 [Vanilla planifolia]|uniref:Uncharacterized protein n=1 Tax=Vanilla planifolia TaxID=51239 RepID=A0A835VBB9_VANPL|nr:hypothetical protein HPP92_007102 [Vanilla planifolia]KAG0490001.1 hypothetical protein HPP92_006864 [Vanilla planifolia]
MRVPEKGRVGLCTGLLRVTALTNARILPVRNFFFWILSAGPPLVRCGYHRCFTLCRAGRCTRLVYAARVSSRRAHPRWHFRSRDPDGVACITPSVTLVSARSIIKAKACAALRPARLLPRFFWVAAIGLRKDIRRWHRSLRERVWHRTAARRVP